MSAAYLSFAGVKLAAAAEPGACVAEYWPEEYWLEEYWSEEYWPEEY